MTKVKGHSVGATPISLKELETAINMNNGAIVLLSSPARFVEFTLSIKPTNKGSFRVVNHNKKVDDRPLSLTFAKLESIYTLFSLFEWIPVQVYASVVKVTAPKPVEQPTTDGCQSVSLYQKGEIDNPCISCPVPPNTCPEMTAVMTIPAGVGYAE